MDGNVLLIFNRDRRNYQKDLIESSNAQTMALGDNRKGVERRSGEDRRINYAEQRKIVRTKLIPGSYVMLKRSKILKFLWPKEIKFAMILDISLMGLGAQYVAQEIFNYKQNVLSIATNDREVSYTDIPFKVTNDKLITHLPDGMELRRCGIQFENISESHTIHINHFIHKSAGQ